MEKKVLLLDIDYTVINTDSMIDFFVYSLKTKPIKTIFKLPYVLIILVLHTLKIVSLNKAKEAVFSPIVNYTEGEIEQFFTNVLEQKINSNMRQIIKKAKEENMFIIMITASPYAYMKYFKKYSYADEVIGTELEYTNLRYKNKIVGNNCKGEDKIVKIQALLANKGLVIDFENSYAYSDSKSDLPMLSLVKNAYLVNKKDGKVKSKIDDIKIKDLPNKKIIEKLNYYKESIMYLIFGGLTVLVNLVIYTALTRVLDINYMISNIIAWIVAVLFAYVTNKFFVFESKEINLSFLVKEISAFVSCRLVSGIMEMALMYLMIDLIGLNDFIVKVFTNILVIILNYILSKVIIFSKKNTIQEATSREM